MGRRATLASTVLAVLAAAATLPLALGDHKIFMMCVPDIFWEDCAEMVTDSAMRGIPIACISGRDRFECIEKVGRKEADVVAVDPEDMYLAAKNHELSLNPGFSVVEQVRTKEEPEEPYRYEAVAVIHKDENIDSVQGLRGLRSCHTGVGRNVGYKIPITKLTAMGVLKNLNDPEYSARENELRALSSLFSKGCLVGDWSPDPHIDKRLKESYSNMCALCEHPDVCNYPDRYSGYDGALRCLAHNGGQVAWTKVIYVKRFFGLPVGVMPAVPTTENPADYRYFCPDGSKVPIDANTKPCTWAARPWQGYMVNNGVQEVKEMQKELTELGKLGEEEKASWWRDIMLLNDKTLAVAAPPISPEDHLKTAKYLDVIERNSGAPEKNARWCVWDQISLEKCQALSRAAFSRDVRPRFDCILQKDQEECQRFVRDENADLLVAQGCPVIKDGVNLKPIVTETYGPGSTKFGERAAVIVVKKDSDINELANLRGKKSCHSGYSGDFAGWTAPVHLLKEKGLISSEGDLVDFFDGSCVPGASPRSKLCQQCVGNLASGDDQIREATRCKPNEAEAYSGGEGAVECLIAGKGDVAFVPLPALLKLDKKNANATGPRSSDFRLICPGGTTAPVENWEACNIALEPPRILVSSALKSVNAIEELTHGTLAAAELYSEDPDLLRLFGRWGGHSNVLFKDDAIGLASIDNTWTKEKWDSFAATCEKYGL